jgi:hypothetical protein
MSEDISDIIQEEVIESTTPIVEPSSPALTPFPIIVEPVVPEINTAEVLIEITKITFQQIFENFLNQNKEIINKFNVKITPEMKKYFLFLCKQRPYVFNQLELSFKNIIVDDKIDIKDIPEIIVMVNIIYKVIKKDKLLISTIDRYELIKTFLHLLFMIYASKTNIHNTQLMNDVNKIIETSIELIKLKSFKAPTMFSAVWSLVTPFLMALRITN